MLSTNNGRATVNSSLGGTAISVPAKKVWFVMLFLLFWLGGWATGWIAVFQSIFLLDSFAGPDAFLLFWLAAWTVGGAFVILFLLWSLFGIETLQIGPRTVYLKKEVFGLGLTKELNRLEVKNVRLNDLANSSLRSRQHARMGMGEGRIKLDYGMKTFTFGMGIEEAEASHLITLIQAKLAI